MSERVKKERDIFKAIVACRILFNKQHQNRVRRKFVLNIMLLCMCQKCQIN